MDSRGSNTDRSPEVAVEQAREALDLELRQRLPERDPQALESFYEVWFDRIYAFVRRMVGEEHLAEDLTQEIFMQIHRTFPSYDPARPLEPWIFTIATNKVRDRWRSRRHRLLEREVSLEEDARAGRALSKDRGPSGRMENQDLAKALAQAVTALPEKLRVTLGLRYYAGLSFEEIAAILGRNEGAVRKRYSRAIEELRRTVDRGALAEGEGGA